MHLKKLFGIMLVFFCLTFTLLLTPTVNSDGCVFIPTVEEWIMSYEEKQMALIDYEDGIEELTISVDIRNSSLNASKAFWIFPIPSKPEDADIDITNDIDFHYYGREDIRDKVKDDILGSMLFMSLSQSYVSIFPFLYFYVFSYSMGYSANSDIEIYDHIEKMGLTSELIYANTSLALDQYLNDKNISLPENATNVIDEYIGKDYSFVVSWISDLDKFKNETYNTNIYEYYWQYQEPHYIFGLKVSFPTDEIFYPMKLTSIYGDKKIPVLIQINGHVTPENNYDEMSSTYYEGYTEIEINTKASEFTEDLLIKNEAPASVQIADWISSNFVLFSIIIFVLSSIFASLISSAISYYKNKPIYWKFALIGLSNFLTIFFVFFICSIMKTSQKFVKKPIKEKNPSKKLIFSFRLTFLILGILTIASVFLMFLSPYFLFMLAALLITYGVLMFIYGGIKDPRTTIYIGLFSIFFFVFLALFSISLTFLIN